MSLDLSKYKNQAQQPLKIGSLVIPTAKPKAAPFEMVNTAINATINTAQTDKTDKTITRQVTIPNQITAWNADGTSKDIELNAKQYEFASLVANGFSCVLIGAAGTGKTTCTQAGIAALLQSGSVLHISDTSHKHIKSGSPGLLVTSYTRRAVQNIKRQMPLDIAANTITIHKALEFAPVFYEVIDENTGKVRQKRIFEPKRGILNKLCRNIKTVVIDEASMLSVEYSSNSKMRYRMMFSLSLSVI